MHDWKDDRIFERACFGLAAMGHDVHLVATKEVGAYILNEDEKIKVNSDELTSVISGVNIHWIKPRSGIKELYNLLLKRVKLLCR